MDQLNEIKDLNYREIIVNPCRVFYKVESEQVYIVHVLRQERAIQNYILDTVQTPSKERSNE